MEQDKLPYLRRASDLRCHLDGAVPKALPGLFIVAGGVLRVVDQHISLMHESQKSWLAPLPPLHIRCVDQAAAGILDAIDGRAVQRV